VAYREAQDKANAADAAFRVAVHPKIWELHKEIAELARHVPGLAPALHLAWEHAIDTRLDDVGRCCTTGPVDP
jgi:hypothetical protein